MGRVPVGSWTHRARHEQGIRPSGEGKGKKNKKRGHTFPQLHSQALQTSWGRSCGPAAPTRHSRGAPLHRSVRPSIRPSALRQGTSTHPTPRVRISRASTGRERQRCPWCITNLGRQQEKSSAAWEAPSWDGNNTGRCALGAPALFL